MKLILPLPIWQQIQGYANAAVPNEVTGLGTIQRDGENFIVDEIFLPEQVSNAMHCEAVDGATNGIIFDLIKDNPARAGELRFRWHSHADGAVYWSMIDENDISKWDAPWVVNLVTNIHGDKKARLDVFDSELRLPHVELEVEISFPEPVVPAELQKKCNSEVKAKVKPRPSLMVPDEAIEQMLSLDILRT